jgi:CheY-like chemotaxis protein
VFRIVLPVGSSPAQPIASDPSSRAAPARDQRILVVDDDPAVAELLAEFLTDEGHQVDVAEHGKAALVRMESIRYDVVLSDLRMPELNGPGLYREVRQRFPEMLDRFVFITGDSLTEETREFLERSTVPYLSKPLSIENLHRVVQRIIADRRSGATSSPSIRESAPPERDD